MSAINSTLSTAYTVLYINFGLNALASLTTLVLLRYMWTSGRLKLNLYTKCVLQMTSYQLMYEISTPLIYQAAPVDGYAQGESAGAFLLVNVACILGGTGSSLWSLMLLVSASFTVYYSRQPTAREQLAAIIVVNALLFGYAIPNAFPFYKAYLDIGTRFDLYMACWTIYDYVRLTLIGLSATVLSYLYYVMVATSVKGQRNRSPLYHLLWKIVPYPIILSVARLGATTYVQVYGDIANFPAAANALQTLWLFAFVFLTPIVGIGCYIAFIKVTSDAWRSLIQMLHLDCMFAMPAAPPAAAAKLRASEMTMRKRVSDARRLRDTEIKREHAVNGIRESRESEGEGEGDGGAELHTPRESHISPSQLELEFDSHAQAQTQTRSGVCMFSSQEAHELLLCMDEDELAIAMTSSAHRTFMRGFGAKGMSENEEAFAERISYSFRASSEL